LDGTNPMEPNSPNANTTVLFPVGRDGGKPEWNGTISYATWNGSSSIYWEE